MTGEPVTSIIGLVCSSTALLGIFILVNWLGARDPAYKEANREQE